MKQKWLAMLALPIAAATLRAQSNGSIIYRFQNSSDGALPAAPLITDASGNLYGTTGSNAHDYGTVFRLTPPLSSDGKWEETTLYSFRGQPDGAGPLAALVIDPQGNLYGTTVGGGTCGVGTVFKLTPPPIGGPPEWTEQVLHNFAGADDGADPTGPLARDTAGNLYGMTTFGGISGAGVVFELSPSHENGAWPETLLYSFLHDYDDCTTPENIVLGSDASLYGVCYEGGRAGDGLVFSLTRSGGAWIHQTIFEFAGGLTGWRPLQITLGPNGNLYGTTFEGGVSNGGVVFELLRPGLNTTWTENILHYFPPYTANHPLSSGVGVSFGPDGIIYGSTGDGGVGYGSVYRLTPPVVSNRQWTETPLYAFPGGFGGNFPEGPPVLGFGGLLYGTTGSGGYMNPCPESAGCGAVYAVNPQ